MHREGEGSIVFSKDFQVQVGKFRILFCFTGKLDVQVNAVNKIQDVSFFSFWNDGYNIVHVPFPKYNSQACFYKNAIFNELQNCLCQDNRNATSHWSFFNLLVNFVVGLKYCGVNTEFSQIQNISD